MTTTRRDPCDGYWFALGFCEAQIPFFKLGIYMFVELSWAAAATRNPQVSTALLHHSRRRQQWVTTCLPARNLSNQSSAPSVMSISAHGVWNIYRLEWEHTHKYCRNSHWNVHKMFLTFYYRAKLSALGDRQTNIEVNITPALDGWMGDGWMDAGMDGGRDQGTYRDQNKSLQK